VTLDRLINVLSYSVQFYNDENCSIQKPGFNASLSYWLNLQGNSSNAKIVLGVPGDDRDSDVTKAEFFVPADQV
jgi:hypothetical protein